MKKNYGLPYMGSKNKLAEEIVNFLPQKKVLVDLFGGNKHVVEKIYTVRKSE